MQRVEAFLVLQFEVDGCARDQHVDDIVVVSCDCVVQGRVALNILHRHHRRFSDRFQRQSELPGPPPLGFYRATLRPSVRPLQAGITPKRLKGSRSLLSLQRPHSAYPIH